MFTRLIKKNNLYKIIFGLAVVLIVLFSVFPRSVEVLNHNYLFLMDQGRDYMAVKDIVVNHKFTLIGSEIGGGAAGTQGVFQGPVYYYLLSLFFLIFKGDPYGGVVMMLIFGFISVAFSYFFAKKIFGNNWYGLLMAFLVAISHPLIDQARFIWNNHPSTIFIFLAFYCIYLARKGDGKYIFLSAFLSAFIYNFEIAIAVPISIALICYSIFILRYKKVSNYICLFTGFMMGVFPMILFELRHNFIGTRGVLAYIFVRPEIYLKSNVHYGFVSNHLSAFIANFFDTFSLQNYPYAGIIFLTFLVLLIVLIIKESKPKIKSFMKFLFILLAVTLLIFSFLRNYVYYYYLYHLSVLYIFIAVYIVYRIFNGSKKHAFLRVLTIIIIFLLTFRAINFSYSNSIRDYSDYGGVAKVKGKIDAINYIYKDAKGTHFGLLVFTPPVYTYPYDYLVWWYGKRIYNYLPYEAKQGTYYLLIETDPAKPWSYRGWLETVIKSGKVIYTKILPSGFIVQKRIGG